MEVNCYCSQRKRKRDFRFAFLAQKRRPALEYSLMSARRARKSPFKGRSELKHLMVKLV